MKYLLRAVLILFAWLAVYSIPRAAAIVEVPLPPWAVPEAGTPPPLRPSHWQDQALLLAGRPLPKSSPFYAVSRTPAFQKHAARMRAFWWQVLRESVNQIGKWRDKNIPKNLDGRLVFYPLSGADYLNAYAFFPRASNYLFVALETPGDMPDLTRMDDHEREQGLIAIRRAVGSLATVNYMQSKVLRQELSNPYLPGTLPVFLMLAGVMGQTVLDVKAVRMEDSGELSDCDFEPYSPTAVRDSTIMGPGPVRGLRMVLRDTGQAVSKTLVYLQIRLRDEAVTDRTSEGRYLRQLWNCNTIFKSAVYLLHNDAYKDVRNFVLQRSDLVIQDDSGLPYASFARGEWEEHLFGTYTRIPPLGGIPHPPQQPQLARRYREQSEPLAFPYGYGVLQGKDHSNLMLFVRRNARAALR